MDTPPVTVVERREERKERRKKERSEQVSSYKPTWNFLFTGASQPRFIPEFCQVAYKLEQEIALWDPNAVLEATSDPFKTLFVARVNFYTRYLLPAHSVKLSSEQRHWKLSHTYIFSFFSESKLKREFEQYGTVKSIRMVMSTKDTKPRGYAFIEYEHEKDMHCKY